MYDFISWKNQLEKIGIYVKRIFIGSSILSMLNNFYVLSLIFYYSYCSRIE